MRSFATWLNHIVDYNVYNVYMIKARKYGDLHADVEKST